MYVMEAGIVANGCCGRRHVAEHQPITVENKERWLVMCVRKDNVVYVNHVKFT